MFFQFPNHFSSEKPVLFYKPVDIKCTFSCTGQFNLIKNKSKADRPDSLSFDWNMFCKFYMSYFKDKSGWTTKFHPIKYFSTTLVPMPPFFRIIYIFGKYCIRYTLCICYGLFGYVARKGIVCHLVCIPVPFIYKSHI